MKYKLFSMVSIFLLVILALSLQAGQVYASQEGEEFLAGVPANFPPHYSIDPKTGKPEGFAIDVMDELARRSRIKVRYVVYPTWLKTVEAIEKGEVSLVPNMGIIAERDALMDFTSPVETFQIVIFVREKSTDINSVEDLKEKEVAVVEANKGLLLLRERGGSRLQIHTTPEEAFLSLISGNSDALVFPEPPISTLSRKAGLEGRVKIVGKPLLEIKRGIAVRKGDQELLKKLDNAVKAFIKTPRYEEIYAKWYGNPVPYWTTKRVAVYGAGLIAIALITSSIWRYLSLLRLNKELKAVVEERKKAEEALRKSKEHYQQVFSTAADAMFILDQATGTVLDANCAASRLYGYTREEFLTLKNTDLSAEPDKTARAIKQKLKFAPVRFHRKKDGTVFPVEITASYFEQEGRRVSVVNIRDITERIAMEERERLASRKWQATFDAINDAVCLLDLNGTILQCNKAMADFFGKPATEITGATCWELLHGTPGPIEGCPVVRMKTTLQREKIELQVRGKWISITVDPIMGETGALSGAVHIMSDISERKSMEQGLRDSLDKFRSVAEQSLVGIYIIQDGVFKYVNRTFAELFGYTADELIKTRSPRDLTVPEDWAIVEKHVWRRSAGTFLPGSYEIRGLRKDGGIVMIEVYESQALFGGRTASIGALLDISQRKKAEQAVRDSESKLQAITRTAQDAIILLTDAGHISYWNPAAEKMFGYGAGEVMGKDPAFIIPERFREAYAHAFTRFAETGEGPKLGTTVEMAGLRKSGAEFPLELSIAGFLLNNRRHASGIIRDISERKKLERQLLHAQKMEAIGTLAGGIAHDFNNILNVIIGYGSMVLEGMGADDPSRDHMREILSAADRAANLTKRLLMFSRKDVVDFKYIHVSDIVSGMEKMLSRIIGEDIELRIRLADNEAIVFADAGQMEQVLMNLATNARDAMPTGGSLTISTGSMEIDDDYIFVHGYGIAGKYASISISDTGVGMNAETQKKIFDPFFTTKGVGEGTGLGLSIAYGIIKQHKGFIQVYSEAGRGTLFRILLPLSDRPSSEQWLVEDSSALRGGTETILLAEDEDSLRDLMRIILESFGYTVLAAADGEEAVRMFLENRDRVRLVILDLIMPKKSGKDAADEISRVQPGIRTLFMSGYSEDMMMKQGAIEERFVFIQKPVSPKTLLTKVRELLDA